MKVLIVSDLLNNWAIHNRAKAIQKFLPDINITISEGYMRDYGLAGQEAFDIIHFNFSSGLTFHYEFIMKNLHRCLFTIVNERSYLSGFGVDWEQYKEIMHKAPYKTSVGLRMAKLTGATYIPNGIDEDLFPRPRRPIVGFSGTDREAKNMSVIKAACDQLGLQLRTANYNNNVPDLQHSDMHKFYQSIDVYVHASLTEGFNNTILEALACNVPVLMTREGAWKEFEGWVDYIEPTIEGVTDGLKKFTGRRLVHERFLWKYLAPAYRAMYQRIYEDNHRVQK